MTRIANFCIKIPVLLTTDFFITYMLETYLKKNNAEVIVTVVGSTFLNEQ